MKVLLEGTEEQINNLKLLMEYGSNDLPKIAEQYHLEYLWSVDDVKNHYDVTDQQAMEVLDDALSSDYTTTQTASEIDRIAKCHNYKEKIK